LPLDVWIGIPFVLAGELVMFRHFDTSEARSGSLGEIGCNLDLFAS
jgi:hypothetical protein